MNEDKELVILDLTGEYNRFSEIFGANIIKVDPSNITSINPLNIEEIYSSNMIERVISTIKIIVQINEKLKIKLTLDEILNEICSTNNIVLSNEDRIEILNEFNA